MAWFFRLFTDDQRIDFAFLEKGAKKRWLRRLIMVVAVSIPWWLYGYVAEIAAGKIRSAMSLRNGRK